MPPTKLAVCVATYHRIDLLRELLESLNEDEPSDFTAELRVVDNDRAGSALAVVDSFRQRNQYFERVEYLVEAQQNIALARNAALEMGPADAYVFVDDDETVDQGWLGNLQATAERFEADVVIGSVIGIPSQEVQNKRSLDPFFQKVMPSTGTVVDWHHTRTSNTWVKGSWFNGDRPLRFDPAFGRSGGSDTHLFYRMEQQGAIFVSCREAIVREIVPKERYSIRWLAKRAYRNGTVYERIRHDSFRNGLLRFCSRLFKSLIDCLLGLISLDRYRLFRAQTLLYLAFGGLLSLIKPGNAASYTEYKEKSRPDLLA